MRTHSSPLRVSIATSLRLLPSSMGIFKQIKGAGSIFSEFESENVALDG